MVGVGRLIAVLLLSSAALCAAEKAKQLVTVNPLPTALNDDFEFRKTKLFFLSESGSAFGGGKSKMGGGQSKILKEPGSGPTADRSVTFERKYRLFGAVTRLDERQRYGDYFDFFWRAKRRADVTVRLEYRQQALHSFVQARELYYPQARGNMKSEFAIIGDDYLDDGRVIAWRCLLIENGNIVAENRSYLWR